MGLELSFSDDPYRRLGFEYFISTYGIIPSSSENDISLNIILPKVPSTFHKDITGWISIFGKEVPVFDKPENLTDKGEILLEYHDPAGNSYPCAVRTPDGILMGVDLFAHMGKIISGEMESVWESLETTRSATTHSRSRLSASAVK